ncbi:hypothetical protein [Natronobacterium gregoryi]|uniref:Cell surface glycoprotein n=2 Tax=Natronobacterium gregoryi TaxID=44930 RepID=L0AEW2_NATGS|nr:hypothetical protein [Natronobacterium gregoryi]AFZ71974.1 hypothetical protein Natgr_0732 [Natronobacterium gregoryi SP2]ELY62662.1 cell surface glycoprotein [Natronobacterium gregoryi SP2]PLK20829.1 cell surface glycoprotein [Natronobacterium gregoryi SP2]SFJ19313.1 hypothetical protein SAMN05443661_11712 [Natronobacterium gregoryi]
MTTTRPSALAIALATLVVVSGVGAGLAAAGTTAVDDRPTNDAVAAVVDDASANSSFTAYAQEGTIVLDSDHDDPILLPESEEDEPRPEDAPEDVEWEDDSFVVDADVDLEDETWEADTENASIPLITSYRVDADRAEVQMSVPDGFQGTIDPDTGEMTAEAVFEIEAAVIGPLFGLGPDSTCVTETELEMTTETSDNGLSGESLETDSDGNTATALLVDDTFTVPGFEATDGVGAVCDSASDTYGIPAEEPGDNEFELEFWFDLDDLGELAEAGHDD